MDGFIITQIDTSGVLLTNQIGSESIRLDIGNGGRSIGYDWKKKVNKFFSESNETDKQYIVDEHTGIKTYIESE